MRIFLPADDRTSGYFPERLLPWRAENAKWKNKQLNIELKSCRITAALFYVVSFESKEKMKMNEKTKKFINLKSITIAAVLIALLAIGSAIAFLLTKITRQTILL